MKNTILSMFGAKQRVAGNPMVVLKLNISSSRGNKQKLQKVADAVFEEGQSWKKCNLWSKNEQKSRFFQKNIDAHIEAKNFCLHSRT